MLRWSRCDNAEQVEEVHVHDVHDVHVHVHVQRKCSVAEV